MERIRTNDPSRLGRGALVALAILTAVASVLLLATATAAYQTWKQGVVAVSIHEKQPDGVRLHLQVPTVLLSTVSTVALAAMPSIEMPAPEIEAGELRASVGAPDPLPASGPGHLLDPSLSVELLRSLVTASLEGLVQAPDGVLVSVESPREKVLIAKTDGQIVVEVDDAEVTVRVAVSTGALPVLARIAERAIAIGLACSRSDRGPLPELVVTGGGEPAPGEGWGPAPSPAV